MAIRDTRPPPRFRPSLFFSSAGIFSMTKEPKDESGSLQIQPPVKITAMLDPSVGPSPTSVNETDKSQRLSLRKARKLSRVFTDLSLLDSFAERKSVDDLQALRNKPKLTPPRPATAHAYGSLGGHSMHCLDGKPSRLTSPASTLPRSTTPITTPTMSISKSKSSFDNTPQSPIRLNTPPTPQIQQQPSVSLSPQNIPLPPSRPGSSRSPVLVKKGRRSLDLKQVDENLNSRAPLLTRSRSLRITSFSNSSRPSTPKTPVTLSDPPPDARDPPASPETARQHYVEVKRARKMTQLFGNELPQELIRVRDDRRKPEYTRLRSDSTGSLTPDSVPSTPTVEKYANAPEGGNVISPSPPTKPRVEFQERRRRVAKLSQFFGVDQAEIASSLVFAKRDDHHPVDDERRKLSLGSYAEPMEVGVKMISRRRWGHGEDMRDVELSDAINKLRFLKAN